MKKYILAVYDKEIPKLPLPSRWELLQIGDFSKGLKHISDYCPYFLLLKNNIKTKKATEFLKEVGKRFGVIPPSIIIGFKNGDEIKEDEKLSLGIIASFREESSFKTIMKEMEPYLKEPPLPRMTILEFIAEAMVERVSGTFEFKISSVPFRFVLKEGRIEAIIDEVFRTTYRDFLSQGGLQLPSLEKDIETDIYNIDSTFFDQREKIKTVKELAIERVISGLPLEQNFKFIKVSEDHFQANSIGVEGWTILRKLVDKIPLAHIDVLKKCSFKNAGIADFTKYIPLRPEEGYFLHILDKELSFQEIKNLLGLEESKLLKNIYLLFLSGFVSTTPSGGIPPRIQHLKDEVASKEKLIFSQSLSIEQFSKTLQIPGISPYKVLGIKEKATLAEAVESFRNLEHLFRPEEVDPAVQKKFSKHLTFIRSKLTEAILLIESFHFNGKQKQQDILASKMGKTERMESEKTEVQKLEEGRKKEAERLLLAAREYLDNDLIYEAGQYLKTALIYDPFSAPCRHLLAITYLKFKDTRSKYMAEKELKAAIEIDPWNTTYILDLAKLYIEVDMPNRAKALIEQAQRIDPNDPEIKTVRGLLKKGL